MSDNIEQAGTADGRALFGRREMLQRTGFVVGAAALWNTPIVKTIGMSAAASSHDRDSDLCLEEGQGGSGQPEWLVWEISGGGCGATATSQNWSGCSGSALVAGTKYNITIQRSGAGGGNPDSFIENAEIGTSFRYGHDSNVGSSLTVIIYDLGGNEVQRLSSIHTSCSEALDLNDVFGGITLVGGKESGFAAIGASGDFDLDHGDTHTLPA